jgi:ATP-dependent helicase YprA (DUF1998 family)
MSAAPTLGETARSLHAALRDYIEATYHISDERLVVQRRTLLEEDGVIHRRPYIESTPRYVDGERFEDLELPPRAAAVLARAASASPDGHALAYNPPNAHQAAALVEVLTRGRSVILTTGTGSGKTEAFLWPILGHLAEQTARGDSFQDPAVRALLLYPSNALVNDQLGRLRLLFGSHEISTWFTTNGGRPARFARYTSRTLYPGVRTAARDQERLRPLLRYYVEPARIAADSRGAESAAKRALIEALRERGKWPAKPDLVSWFGRPGSRWQDASGQFVRCITLPNDPELLTRHEVLANPPDILVTNYSMLEYMLMRPLERPLFDATRAWLAAHPHERFLVVIDEAHLYRGAAGAEVALLLRRLRDRLGLDEARLQVICTTASFEDRSTAPTFAAELSGKRREDFTPITGDLRLEEAAGPGTAEEAAALASIDLNSFYGASESARTAVVERVLAYRRVDASGDVRTALHAALADLAPMKLLVNTTMQRATPIAELGSSLFPDLDQEVADSAATVLVALGSYARAPGALDGPGLLPSRVHAFFRGLPGLWVCVDPDCRQLPAGLRGGHSGRLYGQPLNRCDCGARVFELYTCRHCGTAYARAYTDAVESPDFLWSLPGEAFVGVAEEVRALEPLDLLLTDPIARNDVRPAQLDLVTGRLNPRSLGPRWRTIYMPSPPSPDEDAPGEFKPCAVCGKSAKFGRSSIQNHQTKGDEPFQALLTRQVEVQQATEHPTPFAPMGGRKALVFSDSRQTAARLAPNLQRYTTRDAVRPLLVFGYQQLQSDLDLKPFVSLEWSYLAVLLAMVELGVRLRPPTRIGETFESDVETVRDFLRRGGLGQARDDKLTLAFDFLARNPAQSVLEAIHDVTNDPFTGLGALALATIEPAKAGIMDALPPLPPEVVDGDQKAALVQHWLAGWRGQWLRGTPMSFGDDRIRPQSGVFAKELKHLLPPANLRAFQKQWLPQLLGYLAEPVGAKHRAKGAALTLWIGGQWGYCQTCRSTQRPFPGRPDLCTSCGRPTLRDVDPDKDPVFVARKGYYRRSTVLALTERRAPVALVAAEHTAQLNDAQADAIFSEAEENELLFQDIDLGESKPAIDVLSCTTTMEVGIDIGALSGVALRNMPPARANYQQRSGRAGRRGKAVATVTAFANTQSHDEHAFSTPDEMIRGPVVDPEVALDNWQIARRHLHAFVLQAYLADRLPAASSDPRYGVQLFEVLGSVAAFRSTSALLNRADFRGWLGQYAPVLAKRAQSWLPSELPGADDAVALEQELRATGDALDLAIDWSTQGQPSVTVASDTPPVPDAAAPPPELLAETDVAAPHDEVTAESLLGRLLDRGVLPRYAFPADVATFYVFDPTQSTGYRHVFRYTPSQNMAVALSQYAPGKRVWISQREWRSGALYSRMREDLPAAWATRRLYLECSRCHYATTARLSETERGDVQDCPACGESRSLGPAQTWVQPPGFAHPWYLPENTSLDEEAPPSYATRAKLTAPTPAAGSWREITPRIKLHFGRDRLLVTNRGPHDRGYTYCVVCGLIEPAMQPTPQVVPGHQKPFPDPRQPVCRGGATATSVVLGTDFQTDVLLIGLRVEPPLTVGSRFESTAVGLRTLSEALTLQASRLLGLGSGELRAEFRPALTPGGHRGLEAEIYLYDTLPGGAGYAQRVGELGMALFKETLELLDTCPAGCDASCYRCLRSYNNQFDHAQLDRHIGSALLRYLLTSALPILDTDRVASSTRLLLDDLQGQGLSDLELRGNVTIAVPGFGDRVAPIWARRAEASPIVVVLHSPFAPEIPLQDGWAEPMEFGVEPAVIPIDELTVRRNLPWASRQVLGRLGYVS